MSKPKDISPEAIIAANEEAKQELHLMIAKMCHQHGCIAASLQIHRGLDLTFTWQAKNLALGTPANSWTVSTL